MLDFILSSLIILLFALFTFIASVKYIKLLTKATLEIDKIPYNKNRRDKND